MPTTKSLPVDELSLDLRNYRTVAQKSEARATHAMILINADRFWALMESILDDGYHPTENLIILKSSDGKTLTVKEGNRRIAALKLIYGLLDVKKFDIPENILDKINNLKPEWKSANRNVPSAIYEARESTVVDKLIALIHGKGELAGRDDWKAVARARHNRDENGATERALDLLEEFLKESKNITDEQRAYWAGDYPLSVLDEAIKRAAPRFGYENSGALVDDYPWKLKKRNILEKILLDIGLKVLTFQKLRDPTIDYLAKYGLEAPKAREGDDSTTGNAGSGKSSGNGQQNTGSGNNGGRKNSKPASASATDEKSVIRALRKFKPRGDNREKLVTMLGEARAMKLDKHAHAFCFVLRVMFELSAKAYCSDHKKQGGPKYTKDGQDRKLEDVLRDVVKHLTINNTDKEKQRLLHGAMTELGKSNGLLSVTSMNQLVHNPKFLVDKTHICTVFNNIFPLLEEMNK